VLEHLRQNKTIHYNEISEYQETKHATALEDLSANELFECVAGLPEIYRTVFNMHAIEGYTHVEIAKELEISDSTVRSRYAKAREMLQKMVKSE
jgi:RNA polymerase sigma-70 factor (ECF subfamily)